LEIYKYIGDRIRELRTSFGGKGISQEELAGAVKVTPNTISRWETATYKPGVEDLERIARALQVSLLELLPPDDYTEQEERVALLLRAAKSLPDQDIDELRRYAEFRRAQHALLSRGVRKKEIKE
jgi:transcriptional regulator with XRE-family HTH domain